MTRSPRKVILTLDEPIFGGLLVLIQQRLALDNVIRGLVQGAVLEALAQYVDNLIVHHTIPAELLIRFEPADGVVHIALIDGRHATEALMVPVVLLLVWFHYGLCKVIEKKHI